MASLTGLAYTSPAVAVLAIDHKLYKVHIYQSGQLAALHLFLQSADSRKSIVFVTSISDLAYIREEENIWGIVLFEDVEAMQKITGITIIDGVENSAQWNRRQVSPIELNNVLSRQDTTKFDITEDALEFASKLTTPITFRELLCGILQKLSELGKEHEQLIFRESTCKYIVGLATKRQWSTKVLKPILALGIDVNSLVELEKWLDTTVAAKALKKSYNRIVESACSADKAAAEFKADVTDLNYIIEVIGVQKRKK